MLLSKDDRVGTFQVTGVLGKGGMGEVYRARDTRLNRDVALKVLPASLAQDPERLARFEREAQLLASLNHPNIATLYGMEESGAVRALVMELVDGPTLADLIKQGPIPPQDAIGMALEIAEAFEYAHGHGVVHRDLKPANVKITSEGLRGTTLKVLDFGLAKALAGEQSSGSSDRNDSATLTMGATATGAIMGTAAYMSPEQVKGKPADRRSDIWAFGVVLAEMLIGDHFYSGETGVEIMAAVVREAPPLERLPKQTPVSLRRLIERCLDKDPQQRLQHIGEARILLQKKDLAVDAGPAPAAVIPVRQRKPWAWIAAAVAATAALAGLAFVHFSESQPAPRNIRFQITPPEKSIFGVFRLSPDGRNLVFVAGDKLWVRSLAGVDAKELVGTQGASYPFWSPDSANIGFFAQGKLKRIALAGGPAVTLCDAANGRGGTWNRDGIIVFSPGPSSPLERVAEAGGVSQIASKFRVADGSEGHRFPEFLPDGRHFLFLASGRQDDSGILVGTLDQMETKRLSEDISNAVFSPPQARGRSGYLLFRRENTLMARPFDPEALAFTGDIFPVAESVGNFANAGFGGFSASEGGILAIGARSGSIAQAVWWDRSGKRLEAVTQPLALVTRFSLSPDEKRLALGIGDNESSEVWIQDMARGAALRLTFGGSNTSPVWSPDGTKIMYGLRQPSGYITDLFEKPASGEGAANPVLRPAGLNSAPWDWARDGSFIAYRIDSDKTGSDLWLLPLTGDRKPVAFLQTPANESNAQFSPDSKLIAYQSNESGQMQVYVQPVAKNGSKWQISTSGGSDPYWRRDGKEIYYLSGRMLMAVSVTLTPSFEAGKPQALFELAGTTYLARGDGQRFLVMVPSADAPEAPPITVVTNWLAGVGK